MMSLEARRCASASPPERVAAVLEWPGVGRVFHCEV